MTPTQDGPSTDPKPYRTSDTPFAAFLHYSGYTLVGSKQDPNDYKREVLVFIFDEAIPKLEQDWRYGNVVGDLRKYHKSLKTVGRYIKEKRDAR